MDVVVGIDAGGTRTRARAVIGDAIVHDAAGGPGNPLSTSLAQLARSFDDALAGCPDPAVVVVCAAGAGQPRGRGRIERLVRRRFPDATTTVRPDYVAALMAAGTDVDVVVVAGTGSVVCRRASASASGELSISGGHGWILGDHGSAARLGRIALERHCATPAAAAADSVERTFGTRDPSRLIAALHASNSPAAFLARAAPLLTAAAEDGKPWATVALERQMHALAATTADHVDRWSHAAARIALAGGVWRSPAASAAFERAVAERLPGASVALSAAPPIDGAVALARAHSR
jgi:N-acetylglucosamine kinase-like BadF-type ATPase